VKSSIKNNSFLVYYISVSHLINSKLQMNIVSKDIKVGQRMSNKIHYITRILFNKPA